MKNKRTSTEKNRIKFRALDVVIIVLILASVVGVYFRYNIVDLIAGGRNLKDYAVSFEIKDIQDSTKDKFELGNKIYYKGNGELLGELMAVTENSDAVVHHTPAIKTVIPEGTTEAIEISYPEGTRIDVSARMSCKGKYSEESGFLLGGTNYIAPGQTISVMTDYVTFDIIITDISLIEN